MNTYTLENHAILIIDDEVDALTNFKMQFKNIFNVLIATSGKEALEILRNYKEKEIAVVVVDQRMPEMTGLELMLQIKKVFPHIVRVLFTGYSETKVIESIVNQAEIFKYIHKPYDRAETEEKLKASIQKYVEDKEKQRHLSATMKLLQKETAEAMEKYTAWVAHHVNNLLQPVKTYVELSAPRFNQNPKETEFAQSAKEYATRIADAVHRLEDIYRHGLENFVKGKVSALLEFENEEIKKAIAQKKIVIKKQAPEPKLEIMVDPEAIREVIRKLVQNSVEASPEGATIEVKAEKHNSDGKDEVMFLVRDYGSGIAPEIKEKLFYPFMKVDATENLRGLGLPYVQAMVARHGGDIHVDSVVGKGTSVSFSLPIIQPEQKETQVEAELDRKAQEILKRKRR